MLPKIILTSLLLAVVAHGAAACNGFKARIIKLENCAGDDAVITIDPDFTVKLNKKCELVPSGCVTNKAFKTATSTFKIQKDGMVMKEGKMDMCALAEEAPAETKDMMKLFGAPASCPVPEEKICTNDHKVDISKYKSMLSMAKGNFIIDSEIEHDSGKSCFHVEMEISKS